VHEAFVQLGIGMPRDGISCTTGWTIYQLINISFLTYGDADISSGKMAIGQIMYFDRDTNVSCGTVPKENPFSGEGHGADLS
jgi:hypothetical protein